MLAEEFFGRPAKLWFEARLRGASRGVLTANVGMTLEDIRRRSTLPMSEPRGESLTGSSRLAADVVFDLDIADTGTRFPECRYYFIVTRSHGDPHVESMNVGVSPHAMTRPEHEDERRRVQERLAGRRVEAGALRLPHAGAAGAARRQDVGGRPDLLAQGRGAAPPGAEAGGRGAAGRG